MFKKSYGGSSSSGRTGGSRGYQGHNPRSGSSFGGSFSKGGSHASGAIRGGSAGGYKGGSRSGGGYKGGFKSGGFRGGRGGGGGGRRFAGQRIDPSKFINKSVVTAEEVFVPKHAFADFAVDEKLKKNVIEKGYTTPTPIQDKIIPEILAGRDVVGIANTGTGKTAAFLIPLIDKVLKNPKEKVIILAPTRELAIQIDNELKGFTKFMKIFSVVCVGGANIVPQLRALKHHNSFVIGTPGRLKDLIERKALSLSDTRNIVLDEADRMLDMGFINDMKRIMALMPTERHSLFFSATLSKEIEVLIKDFLKNPLTVSVKTRDTSRDIDQDVVRVEAGKNKLDVLHDMLKNPEFNKVLIFGQTKHGVERLGRTLAEKGFKADSIHGNKNHSKRQKTLSLFKDNHIQVLVATDVAARGLDIADVSHVINYDLPMTYDDYVHRIGRTGRGGKKGKALTFLG